MLASSDHIPTGVHGRRSSFAPMGASSRRKLSVISSKLNAMGVRVLPVIVESGFRFPTEALYQDLRARAYVTGSDDGEKIVSVVTQLFELIAVWMHPQDAMDVLELRANTLREHLVLGTLKRLVWDDTDVSFALHMPALQELDPEPETSMPLSIEHI